MGLDTAIHALSSTFARRLFRPIMRNRATIFMLHRLTEPAHDIHGHSIEFVSAALRALKQSGAHFVSVRSIVERWNSGQEIGRDEIAFTFDDGFSDQAELLRAVFLPMGCPATTFLITDFLDGKLWPWDDQLAFIVKHTTKAAIAFTLGSEECSLDLSSRSARHKTLERIREHFKKIDNENLYDQIAQLAVQLGVVLPSIPPSEHRPMTWNEVRALAAQGIDFGPHSVSHRIFSRLSSQTAREEIERSWSRLRHELSNPLPVFAWPTGRHSDYGQKDIQLAQQAGLLASVATDDDYSYIPGKATSDDLFRIKRFALPNNISNVLRYGSWIERGRQLLPF